MPTYDYECQKCGKVFEVFHGMNEAGPGKCADPKCKGKVKRLMGAGAGLIFKGSGFYITDYKKKSGSESSGGESKNEGKNEAKSEGKGEAKAETKSEAKTETKTESKPSKSEGKGEGKGPKKK